MPTKVGSHVVVDRGNQKRGWPAFAGHDGVPRG